MILKFDNKVVGEMRRLPRIVAETTVGKAVSVDVWRKGKPVRLQITLGEFPEDNAKLVSATPQQKQENTTALTIGELGMTLSALTPALREQFRLEEDAKGVVITEVAPAGPAGVKRIPVGAIVRKIGPDQEVVTSPAQVQAKVKQAQKAKLNTILVLIETGGTQRFVALNIAKG